MKDSRPLIFGDPASIRRAHETKKVGKSWALRMGYGPSGMRCRDCKHTALQGGVAGRYFKCTQYPTTHGPGTDIRLKDPACLKFEEVGHHG